MKKLFVMRHCESLEDVDKTAYERITDEDMPLTDGGREQAAILGAWLAHNFSSSGEIRLILSPSKRVLETARIIVTNLPSHIKWSLSTDSLIVKQNWGDVTIHNRSAIEKERYQVGVLRYRFPGGESGAEMLFRFNLFARQLEHRLSEVVGEDTLIITHGFEMRVLLKSLLGWSEEYFESLAHPKHCEMKRVAYDHGIFTLLDEMRIHDLSANPNFVRRKSTQ